MRILVVSDTHGKRAEIREVLRKTKPFDYLVHAGDAEGLEHEIEREAGCPCLFVRGNCDYFSEYPKEDVAEIGGHRIFVTHGHLYGVSMDTAFLADEAKSRDCDIAVCGHTHRPMIDQADPEVDILNPGSLAFPRQEGREPSFIMIDIDRYGGKHYTLNYLKRGPKKARFSTNSLTWFP